MKSCIISIVVILGFSLMACGYDPDFITHYHLHVFDETGFATVGEVDCVTGQALAVYKRGHNAIRGMQVFFLSDSIGMENQENVGEFQAGSIPRIRVIWERGNLYETAFIHELAHAVMVLVYETHDPGHTDQTWWGVPDGLVNRAMIRASHECIYH